MEKLKYIIEDSTIAELLGVQSFTNKESAMLELVKNSYDAQAYELSITFKDNEIIIKDNGNGMNSDDIKKNWMHVGKSEKDYEIIDKKNNKRVLAGSKGIGRFALSRLGSNVQIYSQKNDDIKSILWYTDWNESTLAENDLIDSSGTKIIIKKLRDKWKKLDAYMLAEYLSRTCNDELMKIQIIFENKPIPVKKYFKEPELGINCTSIIKLEYVSKEEKLICTMISDEFKEEANKYCEDTDLKNNITNVNIFDELEDYNDIELTGDELKTILKMLGDFSAEFYFSLKTPASKDVEKFLYKNSILSERYDSGIILYRNSFSISSFDGTKDWIGLGKRSRLSPAAATHPTGAWRVRENQLAGKVEIDKKINYMLTDLANRQGLDENTFYKVFVKILDIGLSEFERYRQKIIRKINKKNNVDTQKDKKVIDKVIKDPEIVKDLSKDELNKFILEVKEYKKENSEYKKEISSTEERYKYDVRILNVLATSGLKATSIAHEMHNDRNSISQNCDYIIDAMKEYEIWDLVNEEEKTRYAFSNIPELIKKNRRVNAKMITFMNTMLSEVEKSQFYSEKYNILDLLDEIKKVWERDYAWIEINLDIPSSILYEIPKDVLKVIFDNLILNSIQQNENSNHMSVYIQANLNNNLLEFLYKDNGKGLSKKYINYPMKILEVHETSRKQGHGLGMWIVNNTIVMSGGEIKRIDGTYGFAIQFTVGGKI